MALTKNERRALELAREAIRTGPEEYICFALEDADGVDHETFTRLKQYVRDALGGLPITALEDWQRRNGWNFRNGGQLRADRLAWIDWMPGKPLAGEVVYIEWSQVGERELISEYCGRRFSARRTAGLETYEIAEFGEPEGVNRACPMEFIAGDVPRDLLTETVVFHVWPALPPDEPRHV